MAQEITLHIPSMSCQGCVSNITKALNENGFNGLAFDLNNKTVTVSNEEIDEKVLLKTLRRANYPAETK